ncbi:MAG TPA: GNAT family N-acetyltransferase [Candidatus Acidoferrales bacterium]|nr:GNAT family N-acetyltransferase [Candidatus Acidoferrales bacterium]
MNREKPASARGRTRGAPPIRIRKARVADLPALTALYAELHLDDYDYRPPTARAMRTAFAAIANNRDHQLLVAVEGGKIVGSLHVMIFRHLGHGLHPAAIVENVVVSASQRSRGIGEMLVVEAVKLARQRGCYKLSLTTNIKRARAHRFYERLGWRRSHFGYSLDLK